MFGNIAGTCHVSLFFFNNKDNQIDFVCNLVTFGLKNLSLNRNPYEGLVFQ